MNFNTKQMCTFNPRMIMSTKSWWILNSKIVIRVTLFLNVFRNWKCRILTSTMALRSEQKNKFDARAIEASLLDDFNSNMV